MQFLSSVAWHLILKMHIVSANLVSAMKLNLETIPILPSSTNWGKTKETLLNMENCNKTHTIVCSLAPTTNITQPWKGICKKNENVPLGLQFNTYAVVLTAHYNWLHITTGCTFDTNIQHMHDGTNMLPLHTHLVHPQNQTKITTCHTPSSLFHNACNIQTKETNYIQLL